MQPSSTSMQLPWCLKNEKKNINYLLIHIAYGGSCAKSYRSCHKKKCSQQHQIQEIMMCIFNIEWIAWVRKYPQYIQNATTVLEGSRWQRLDNVCHYLKCYKALHNKGITKEHSRSLHSTMRMDEIYYGLLQQNLPYLLRVMNLM